MRRLTKKTKGIVKGAPSGFIISLLVHSAAFMLAGLLVVFTVHQKEEKKFVPPKPVDRPKMKLKKPKVKVKKSAKPKSTQRIVTKVRKASMPDIQLPEMSGIGDGLAGGIGDGFDIMPDLDEVTMFGAGQSIGNDFVGTFYDFKRDRRGSPIPMDPDTLVNELVAFVRDGWRTSKFARYYQSPKKLYATAFMVPPVRSSVAPSAFGERDTGAWCWVAHYKGQIAYPEDIKFRFWGHGDDVLVVRVGGELVLSACYPSENWGTLGIGGDWRSSAKNNFRFYLGNNLSRVGDWIELKAGEVKDMEVIIGEIPGGGFCSMLTVEVEGVDYPLNRQGGPILPMFKTEEPSLELQDAIYRTLVPGEASVTNGPVFRDFVSTSGVKKLKGESVPDALPEPVRKETTRRMWSTVDGKTFEGEYVTRIADQVVLQTARGKQQKIAVNRLSPDDSEYVELENPPALKITFTKASSQRMIETTPFLNEDPPRVNDYTFGAKVEQTSARSYDHELTMEFFAIGKEFIGDKYILLDRSSTHFSLTDENKRSHGFQSERDVEFMEWVIDGVRRGMEYAGNLVTVTDKRGRIIQYSASNPWLWENLENLKQLPVGSFMDENCIRTHPTSPKPTRY
jgi:hypothetical protein